MSVVLVQVGQCGNQVGRQLFSSLVSESTSWPNGERHDVLAPFFSGIESQHASSCGAMHSLQARAVLVDMEPKAVQKVMSEASRSGEFSYSASAEVTGKKGSGNNWAYGYFVHGPGIVKTFGDACRKQVENCDRLSGLVPVMSLAGGTGSGLGSFLCEVLRETFPRACLCPVAVWPYSSGEVIVQSYNAVLALAKLAASSDGVIAFHNDKLQAVCQRRLGLKTVNLCDLNTVIGTQLSSLLFPTDGVRQCRLHEAIGRLCAHPSYKILTTHCIPQLSEQSKSYSTYLWPGLVRHVRQMLITGSTMEEGMDWNVGPESVPRVPGKVALHSVANLLVLRGRESHLVDVSSLRDERLYPPWSVDPLTVYTSPHPSWVAEKSASLIANSQACLSSVQSITHKAWDMFNTKAYVHQYSKHGVLDADFLQAFGAVEQIISDYAQL